MKWLAPDESRNGLGCMRLSTEPGRSDETAIATVHAALDGGATVFDTCTRGHEVRNGASRGAWRPDGRARSIVADCEERIARACAASNPP
jgi:hypothetical protein